MIMPAFGAFTGGLDAGHDAIRTAMGGAGDQTTAMIIADSRILRFPLLQSNSAFAK
jgi:metallophosphoesterase superfamily enzyme